MEGSSSNKRQAEGRPEGESGGKRQNVTMEMETLDCPICFHPLKPPIYQCSVGHFICSSCHPKLRNKCHLCSVETTFKRCLGMEHVMESVTVPCSSAKYGCTEKIPYYQKEEHEKVCPNVPCFCPESGCGFAGPTAALFDHFNSVHKWPSTTIIYSKSVQFHLQPGLHVLCTKEANFPAQHGTGVCHAISLVCIQPKATNSKYKCAISYSCQLTTGYYQYSFHKIRSSSLSDGLPKGYNAILPKDEMSDGGKRVVLTVSIEDEE